MRKITHVFISIFFSLLFISNTFSQTDTEFWFVAPDINENHDANDLPHFEGGKPRYFTFTAGQIASVVTVSQPANPGFTPIVVEIDPLSVASVDLSYFDSVENVPAGVVNNFGYLITATQPISAYYKIATPQNPDIWALKGRSALGNEFYVVTQTSGRTRMLLFTII